MRVTGSMERVFAIYVVEPVRSVWEATNARMSVLTIILYYGWDKGNFIKFKRTGGACKKGKIFRNQEPARELEGAALSAPTSLPQERMPAGAGCEDWLQAT